MWTFLRNADFSSAVGTACMITRISAIHSMGAMLAREKSSQTAYSQDGLLTILDPSEISPSMKYPLAGQQHLPGSQGQGIPEYISFPGPGLPQAYNVQQPNKYTLSDWATICREKIHEHLSTYGALLFRGLPLCNGDHFSSFVKGLGLMPRDYQGGAAYRPPHDVEASVYLSTTMSQKHNMELHNDMAYSPDYPRKIFFYCEIPAGEGCGGITPIALGTEVLKKLDPNVVEKFEKKQIRYYHCLPTENNGYMPWQASFHTKDPKQVEERLRQMGMTYEWRDNGTLFYWINGPPTITHPITGEKIWFNKVDSHHNSYLKSSPMLNGLQYNSDLEYPNHTTYGDGTPIELEVLQHVRAIKWQCSVGVQLKKNDVLVFDNIKAMHGRLSYTGKRKLLVFMSAD